MKNIPQRTCTVCRERKNKNELLRIVKNKENIIKVDETGKLTLPLPLFVRYETGNIYGVKPNVNSSKTYDDLERFVIGDKTTDWNKTLDEYILSRE